MTKDIEREAFEEFYKTQILTKDYEIEMIDQLTEFHVETGLYEYARMQTAWQSWQAAKAHEAKNLEGCVVVQPQGLILTCEEILEVLEFGAPDLKIKRTEYSEEQMSTEITIVHRETGHSGAGIYAYCTECPEEGAIKLGDVEAAKADAEEN